MGLRPRPCRSVAREIDELTLDNKSLESTGFSQVATSVCDCRFAGHTKVAVVNDAGEIAPYLSTVWGMLALNKWQLKM
jgi:hypothetical protein